MSNTDLEGAPFVVKTFQIVSDPQSDEIVCWGSNADSFIVVKPVEFAGEILPKYFKHSNFCSFIRQLNTYGFHKVESKQWEFKHENGLFVKNGSRYLKDIVRRKSKKREASQIPSTPEEVEIVAQLESPKPLGQVATKPRLNTDIEDEEEVEKLKSINTLLMKEIKRLQQQQESTQSTIQLILDALNDSRKEQQVLQEKVATLMTKQEEEESQNSQFSYPQYPIGDEIVHGLDGLASELGKGLDFNMEHLLHITPPASPYRTDDFQFPPTSPYNYAPASPYNAPPSPYHYSLPASPYNPDFILSPSLLDLQPLSPKSP